MRTFLVHPRKQAQRPQFYPWTCAIKQAGGYGGGWVDVPGLEILPCAYVPGGVPGTFQASAPSRDRLLLQSLYPQIVPGMRLLLHIQGQEQWFLIAATLPVSAATQTLLLIQPLES